MGYVLVLAVGFLMGVYYEKNSGGGDGDADTTKVVKDATLQAQPC